MLILNASYFQTSAKGFQLRFTMLFKGQIGRVRNFYILMGNSSPKHRHYYRHTNDVECDILYSLLTYKNDYIYSHRRNETKNRTNSS